MVLTLQVPTVAIEDVYVWNNTSIMQDEVLAHRVGLVPLKIDPRTLDFKRKPNRLYWLLTSSFELLCADGERHARL